MLVCGRVARRLLVCRAEVMGRGRFRSDSPDPGEGQGHLLIIKPQLTWGADRAAFLSPTEPPHVGEGSGLLRFHVSARGRGEGHSLLAQKPPAAACAETELLSKEDVS